MLCAISGNTPDEPVVSKLSGHVFEKRLIEKWLEEKNTCPVTNQTLTKEDLIEIKASKTVPPRPATATSIPAMLSLFQSEWDAVMFETYSLKQQLENVRQELAHALYQHDAACRVIARLIKERDEARNVVANLRSVSPSSPTSAPQTVPSAESMDVEGSSGITEEVKSALVAKSQELSKDRKKRQPSPGLATAEQIKGYTVVQSIPLHSSTTPGILCVDIHPVKQSMLATGGVDGAITLFNRDTKKIAASLTNAHAKKVTDVMFHPSVDMLFSCSADKTAKVWTAGDNTYSTHHTVSHNGEVVGCTLQPTGAYWASGSTDKTWAFHSIERASTLASIPTGSVLSTIEFHPDGLLLGTGDADSIIKIWDIKNQKTVAVFEGHKGKVIDIAFSENGYYIASIAEDNIVKLWDLRRLKDVHTMELDKLKPTSLQFDYSGTYLAVSGDHIRVFMGKTLNHIATLEGHSKVVNDVKWGQDAHFLASVGMENQLKIFGSKK